MAEISSGEQSEKKNEKGSILDKALVAIAVAMVLYHLISTQYMLHGSYEHQDFHLGFALLMIFFNSARRSTTRLFKWLFLLAAALSLVSTGYIRIFMRHLEEAMGYPEFMDVAIGVLLLILVIEATRQAWGYVLPVVSGVFMLYFLFGHHIPGALYHRPFTFYYIITYLDIGFQGIFGTFLSISANYVFLFVVFGSLLGITRIEDFFYEVGKAVGQVMAGGPAHTAVVASSLVGMVSGSAVANVTITGAFTIPLMKKVGYKPEYAGAIEATASTGGQLMPPIMGASAFLMASFLGVPYVKIMLAAIIPAILYYLCVGLGVQLLAVKHNIRAPAEPLNKKLILKRFPLFVVPVAILVFLLLKRYTPMYAAFWAIVGTLLFSFSWSILIGEKPYNLHDLASCMAKGALSGANIGIALACVGLIAQTLITTALGNKIIGLVEILSGGYLIAILGFTMIMSIILGCGTPTAAAYSLVAILVIPVLVRQGVMELSAHFFAFYFAIISALTPPVALAAMAGAGMAKGNYFSTAVEAFKLAISGFVIPFLIIFNPVLILKPINPLWGMLSLISIPLGLAALTSVIYGQLLRSLSSLERCIMILACIGFLGFSFMKNYLMFAMGSIFFIMAVLSQRKARRVGESNV